MGSHSYIHLYGIKVKRSWGGEVRNVARLVAMGEDGCRKVLGRVTRVGWKGFLKHIRQRGLKRAPLITLVSACSKRLQNSIRRLDGNDAWFMGTAMPCSVCRKGGCVRDVQGHRCPGELSGNAQESTGLPGPFARASMGNWRTGR